MCSKGLIKTTRFQYMVGHTTAVPTDSFHSYPVITMCDKQMHLSIYLVIAALQLGDSLFLTALPMMMKERCINESVNSNSTSMEDSWQTTVSTNYMIYRMINQLLPIFSGLCLGWLADRGWRIAPILVPLMGFMVSRLVMLLILTLDWPLYVLLVEETITGLCGGFPVCWSGTTTLLSLSSTKRDRSKVMMRAELTRGIAGVVGCMASGHLFDLTIGSWRHGVIVVVLSVSLYAFCILYILLVLQNQAAGESMNQKELDAKTGTDDRKQAVKVVLLWLAAILYTPAQAAAKNILDLFQLMEPLHWSVEQIGYGNASGFFVVFSSYLGTSIMSRWFSDVTMITIGMLSYAAGMSLMAFVTTPYMFYTARVLTLFSLMPTPLICSLLSQQVKGSSYGIVLTSLQISWKGSTVGYNLFFTKIYQHTLSWFPGLVFIITSVFTMVAIIPIRLFDSELVVGCSYQRVHEDRGADKDDSLSLMSNCSEDSNHLNE